MWARRPKEGAPERTLPVFLRVGLHRWGEPTRAGPKAINGTLVVRFNLAAQRKRGKDQERLPGRKHGGASEVDDLRSCGCVRAAGGEEAERSGLTIDRPAEGKAPPYKEGRTRNSEGNRNRCERDPR